MYYLLYTSQRCNIIIYYVQIREVLLFIMYKSEMYYCLFITNKEREQID